MFLAFVAFWILGLYFKVVFCLCHIMNNDRVNFLMMQFVNLRKVCDLGWWVGLNFGLDVARGVGC